MYHISPAPHSNGLMIAYIPKEKVLFQGDFSLPAPGQPANDHVKALVPALEKLNLGLRSLHQRARVRGAADQGGRLEGRRQVAASRASEQRRCRRPPLSDSLLEWFGRSIVLTDPIFHAQSVEARPASALDNPNTPIHLRRRRLTGHGSAGRDPDFGRCR